MKVIIAGGRDFYDYKAMCKCLDGIDWFCEELVSGAARGADSLGEQWAMDNKVPIARFPADWNTYGKRAGYLRNEQMADYADALVAFWDGESKGTKHMIDIANRKGLLVHVCSYAVPDYP